MTSPQTEAGSKSRRAWSSASLNENENGTVAVGGGGPEPPPPQVAATFSEASSLLKTSPGEVGLIQSKSSSLKPSRSGSSYPSSSASLCSSSSSSATSDGATTMIGSTAVRTTMMQMTSSDSGSSSTSGGSEEETHVIFEQRVEKKYQVIVAGPRKPELIQEKGQPGSADNGSDAAIPTHRAPMAKVLTASEATTLTTSQTTLETSDVKYISATSQATSFEASSSSLSIWNAGPDVGDAVTVVSDSTNQSVSVVFPSLSVAKNGGSLQRERSLVRSVSEDSGHIPSQADAHLVEGIQGAAGLPATIYIPSQPAADYGFTVKLDKGLVTPAVNEISTSMLSRTAEREDKKGLISPPVTKPNLIPPALAFAAMKPEPISATSETAKSVGRQPFWSAAEVTQATSIIPAKQSPQNLTPPARSAATKPETDLAKADVKDVSKQISCQSTPTVQDGSTGAMNQVVTESSPTLPAKEINAAVTSEGSTAASAIDEANMAVPNQQVTVAGAITNADPGSSATKALPSAKPLAPGKATKPEVDLADSFSGTLNLVLSRPSSASNRATNAPPGGSVITTATSILSQPMTSAKAIPETRLVNIVIAENSRLAAQIQPSAATDEALSLAPKPAAAALLPTSPASITDTTTRPGVNMTKVFNPEVSISALSKSVLATIDAKMNAVPSSLTTAPSPRLPQSTSTTTKSDETQGQESKLISSKPVYATSDAENSAASLSATEPFLNFAAPATVAEKKPETNLARPAVSAALTTPPSQPALPRTEAAHPPSSFDTSSSPVASTLASSAAKTPEAIKVIVDEASRPEANRQACEISDGAGFPPSPTVTRASSGLARSATSAVTEYGAVSTTVIISKASREVSSLPAYRVSDTKNAIEASAVVKPEPNKSSLTTIQAVQSEAAVPAALTRMSIFEPLSNQPLTISIKENKGVPSITGSNAALSESSAGKMAYEAAKVVFNPTRAGATDATDVQISAKNAIAWAQESIGSISTKSPSPCETGKLGRPLQWNSQDIWTVKEAHSAASENSKNSIAAAPAVRATDSLTERYSNIEQKTSDLSQAKIPSFAGSGAIDFQNATSIPVARPVPAKATAAKDANDSATNSVESWDISGIKEQATEDQALIVDGALSRTRATAIAAGSQLGRILQDNAGAAPTTDPIQATGSVTSSKTAAADLHSRALAVIDELVGGVRRDKVQSLSFNADALAETMLALPYDKSSHAGMPNAAAAADTNESGASRKRSSVPMAVSRDRPTPANLSQPTPEDTNAGRLASVGLSLSTNLNDDQSDKTITTITKTVHVERSENGWADTADGTASGANGLPRVDSDDAPPAIKVSLARAVTTVVRVEGRPSVGQMVGSKLPSGRSLAVAAADSNSSTTATPTAKPLVVLQQHLSAATPALNTVKLAGSPTLQICIKRPLILTGEGSILSGKPVRLLLRRPTHLSGQCSGTCSGQPVEIQDNTLARSHTAWRSLALAAIGVVTVTTSAIGGAYLATLTMANQPNLVNFGISLGDLNLEL